MDRNARDIVEKMKEYRADENAIHAMADMLLFMGIAEAPEFAAQALKEMAHDKAAEKQMQRAYAQHLKQGFKNYIPYAEFKRKKEAGEI